jgi:hypothetical protein
MRTLAYILGPALFLVAVLGVWAAMLPACAAAPFLGRIIPGRCPPVAASATESALLGELARGRALLAQLKILERELAALDKCAEPPRIERAAPLDHRAETAPDRIAPDRIDPDQWAARDIGLLEGCWLLESDYKLKVRSTGEEITVPHWRACFDAEGNGQQDFQLSNDMECKGPISARFNGDGAMTLSDGASVPCSRNAQIVERTGICTLDAAQIANCAMRDDAGVSNLILRRDR